MDDPGDSRKRGPYKRYLKDKSIDVPASTRFSRLLKNESSEQVQRDDENCAESSLSTADSQVHCNSDNSFDSSSTLRNSERDNHIKKRCVSSKMTERVGKSSMKMDEDEFQINEGVHVQETTEGDLTNDDFNNSNDENDVVCEVEDEYFNNDLNIDLFAESDTENENEVLEEEFSTLYEGCDISRKESEMIIMAMALRHNMTDICLQHMLSMIDCHLPHTEYKSKYKFLQSFHYPKYVEYFYCDECILMLNFVGEETICERCRSTYRKSILRQKEHFFIYLPLEDQLKELVNNKIFSHYRNIKDGTADVVNSPVYRKLRNEGVIGDNNLTINWNTDGVSMFQSSKENVWPLQICINELPYRIRKNNIILCGVWKNKKKPYMNLYLQPFIDEMIQLSNIGFRSSTFLQKEEMLIKVHALLCSVDSVARPAIQNVKQFNGIYGCSYCFNKGEAIPVKRGYARIYSGVDITHRNAENHLQLVTAATRDRKTIKGVKGPSIVSLLPHSDIINSFPPEYMHSCLLGVGKLFVTEWFDSANSQEEWYLGSKSKEFNRRLVAIKPPTEITRTPQSISEKYKASEWKSFILYYSLPCLNGLMRNKYFNHWFLFVFSLNIYLKDEISDDELTLANESLVKFVEGIEKLYGTRFMKFNVHLLLHIPSFVEKFGALWAWSAFPFESFNGTIKQLFHGTQYIAHQIQKLYFRLRYIKNHTDVFDTENCSPRARTLFIKLMNESRVSNCIQYGQSLRVFGKCKSYKLSVIEKVAIQTLLRETCEELVHAYN